ncbi:phage Tail Collar domain protein [Collimonas fungivorans]|uniref:Phage Tail Collar domain protein n=1 Tax=Collimonas fungivorans TaxID=158899 RepID=A0A127PCD4_9BURK|nr:tail fiber protein [Collimonas fungivorans]AMO95458.1 phage Tail Collar domain protein [Collimonas fungivorans]
MAEYYVGQIMLSGFNFAPRGFAACNGQLMPISQNQALFSLLGTMYGGNGQTTFALPNLQGSTPVHAGSSADPNWQPAPYIQGQLAGVENVTLQPGQLPVHNHLANATTTAGSIKNPTNTLYGGSGTEALYGQAAGPQVTLAPQTVASVGGNGAHNNMQPFRVLNFSIALSGVFPPRN